MYKSVQVLNNNPVQSSQLLLHRTTQTGKITSTSLDEWISCPVWIFKSWSTCLSSQSAADCVNVIRDFPATRWTGAKLVGVFLDQAPWKNPNQVSMSECIHSCRPLHFEYLIKIYMFYSKRTITKSNKKLIIVIRKKGNNLSFGFVDLAAVHHLAWRSKLTLSSSGIEARTEQLWCGPGARQSLFQWPLDSQCPKHHFQISNTGLPAKITNQSTSPQATKIYLKIYT